MDNVALMTVLGAVDAWEPSELSSHEGPCCLSARAWFRAMALSHGEPLGLLEWIHKRWVWGPTRWPIAWCEAMRAHVLDCGALAAIARAAVETYGQEALAVQMIACFDESAGRSWRRLWEGELGHAAWVFGDLVYHEGIALLDGASASVWDPTDGLSLDARPASGYDSLAAIRLSTALSWPARSAAPERVQWRGREVALGVWHTLVAPVIG